MGDRVLYEFEFTLRQELINKLLAVEPFSEKWDFKNSENRITNSDEGAKLESCHYMHHSLVIEKTSSEESKLVVKIYDISKDQEKHNGESQTKSIETKNERLQTNLPEVASCQVQVQPDTQNLRTQTNEVFLRSVQIQTDESRVHSDLIHKATESDFNLGSQFHKEVMVQPCMVQMECQATVTMAESECQNVTPMENAMMQTELNISSTEAQTDLKEFCNTLIQTSTSMACEAEISVQAVCETSEQGSQVQQDLSEEQVQTDMSMSLQMDSEMQATAETEAVSSQTEILTSEADAETEFNLSTQCHVEAQSSVEVVDSSFQTEPQCVDFGCLTDHNLSTQESRDIQTGSDDQNNLADLNDTSACLNPDDSILDHSQDVSNFSHVTAVDRLVDGVSQTDPVTIIIGDASFLVQKLKSSAMNASKVTTSGNEIEIELSADMVEQEIPEQKEKSPAPGRVIPLEIKPTQPEVVQPPPKFTTPRVGGVRMRMPVSTTPWTPNSGKMPQPSFQARVPNATNTISPQIQKTPQTSQQNKPSTGLFSCPFCNLCFIESPALYEHLSASHQSDLKSKWKKSQGREGKTIIPRNSQQPPQAKKLNQDAAKSVTAVKPGLCTRVAGAADAGNITWPGLKRKKQYTNICRKYRRVEDDDEEEDDDDEFYEDDNDEDYVRPRKGGRI